MRTPPAAFLVTVLALAADVNTFPNKMPKAVVTKIASQLPLGIAEREMYLILETNGLKWACTAEKRPVRVFPEHLSILEMEKEVLTATTNAAPAAEAWCLYALSDGWLRLDVSLASGTSTNRVLRAAYSVGDGGKLESITHTNRP